MTRTHVLAATVAAAFLTCIAVSAPANPESGPWLNVVTGAVDTVVDLDESIQYTITSNTDSVAFSVRSPRADVCFDPDTGGATGTARVTVYRSVTPTTVTLNGAIPITVPSDNSDCVVIVRGAGYWIETTAGPTGGEVAVVTVTGRSN